MPRRYLFGPVTADFADEYLRDLWQAGHCLVFNHRGDADLAVGWNDTWEVVQARWPAGWRPDFLVLYLPYATIPPAWGQQTGTCSTPSTASSYPTAAWC